MRSKVSVFRYQDSEDQKLTPEYLYKTSHGWNSEPQNIECRTAECNDMSLVPSTIDILI